MDAPVLQGCSLLLHGPPKVGKTTLAASFPGPVLILATEDRHRHLDPEVRDLVIHLPPIPSSAWDVFTGMASKNGGTIFSYMKELKPRTVVIDTIGHLIDGCYEKVCRKNNWSHPSEGDTGKGWDFCKTELRRGLKLFLAATRELDATRILIAHTKTQEIKTSRTEFSRITPDISDSRFNVLSPEMDHIWCLLYDEASSAKDLKVGIGPRALYLNGYSYVQAGSTSLGLDVIRDVPERGQYDYIMGQLAG